MNKNSIVFTAFLLLLFTAGAEAQLRPRSSHKSETRPIIQSISATPAFAEVLLRQTELESLIEELLVSYKEDFPKVKEARYELGLLQEELVAFGLLNDSDAPKLTLALGKLIVRRSQLASEYWIVSNKYSNEHPAAKKARRKFEIYDRAVKKIL